MRSFWYPSLLWIFCAFVANGIEYCPSGTLIIEKGLTPIDEEVVASVHNRVRQEFVSTGRAKCMKTLNYDQSLAHKAVPITRQCADNPLDVKDRRWSSIGQNTHLECSSDFDPDVHWEDIVEGWFAECRYFEWPNRGLNHQDVSHCRQLLWANSDAFGCDFVLFVSGYDDREPFCKLYACNYAFGANNAENVDLAPYDEV